MENQDPVDPLSQGEPGETDEIDEGVPVKTRCGSFDAFFQISQRRSSAKVEIISGITTFLSMAYILTVNPNQLDFIPGSGAIWSSLFLATCFGSVVGCVVMALYANAPYAQAPGMGLNSQVGLLVKSGAEIYGFSFAYENAMALGFIYAIIVFIVTVLPVGRDPKTNRCVTLREKVFDGIPECVRDSISAGIGLFICFVGLNGKLVHDAPFTLVKFVQLKDLWRSEDPMHLEAKIGIVTIITFLTIAILSHFKVSGAIIIGILFGTIIGIPLKVSDTDTLIGKGDVTWKFWKSFENYFKWNTSEGGLFLSCFRGFNFPKGSAATIIMLIISLGMVDLFDTMGTVVGCAKKADLLDKDGKPIDYGETIFADSTASLCASLLGTSSVTTYVESSTGIVAGGKTGLSILVVAICFLLSIFLLPLFAFIPSAAASAALIYVGVLMMSTIEKKYFEDSKTAIPAFVTIVMMPFGYSITEGIGLGLLMYVIIFLIVYIIELIGHSCGVSGWEKTEFPFGLVTGIITILFVIYFFVPTHF